MGNLILIRVPDEFRMRVSSFCTERGYPFSDATVTLIDPSLLGKIPGLQQKLQSFCLAQRDFNMVLGGAARHGDQLLYLGVLPGMVSMVRERLMGYLKIPPGEKPYRPHLTLMHSSAGRGLNMEKMLADAKSVFTPPYQFTVGAFELYTQKGNEPFKPAATIHFTGR